MIFCLRNWPPPPLRIILIPAPECSAARMIPIKSGLSRIIYLFQANFPLLARLMLTCEQRPRKIKSFAASLRAGSSAAWTDIRQEGSSNRHSEGSKHTGDNQVAPRQVVAAAGETTRVRATQRASEIERLFLFRCSCSRAGFCLSSHRILRADQITQSVGQSVRQRREQLLLLRGICIKIWTQLFTCVRRRGARLEWRRLVATWREPPRPPRPKRRRRPICMQARRLFAPPDSSATFHPRPFRALASRAATECRRRGPRIDLIAALTAAFHHQPPPAGVQQVHKLAESSTFFGLARLAHLARLAGRPPDAAR